MKQIFVPLLCLAATLLPLPRASAQTSARSEERGWGSSWTTPVTEEQRHRQQFADHCETLEKAGNFQGVVDLCTRELQQQPEFYPAYVGRASAQASLKKYDLALADLNRAKAVLDRKDWPAASATLLVIRAEVNEYRKDYRAATNDLRSSLKIDRTNPQALNSLAWLLATAPDGTARNGKEAISLAKRALAVSPGSRSYAVTDTLAAYAEASEYPRAIETARQALEAARKEIKDPAKLAKFQQEATDWLHLFEQQQPYRFAQKP